MMKRIPRWVYYAAGSVLLAIYLTVMTAVSTRSVESQMCTGLLITVHDTAELRFINPYELARDLGDLPSTITRTRRCDINLDSLERLLASFDKIERVNVNLLTDGKVHIDVWQMRPVARIFGPVESSYYINRTGKRIKADARYHIDVPVVYGSFNDSIFPATSILPLVDYIQADSVWSRMVSMIKVDSPDDIILVPVICNHLINLGDTTNYPDKFRRLAPVYSRVMKVKGWNYYDTISVKWAGQVVAHRRNYTPAVPDTISNTEDFESVEIQIVTDNVPEPHI